MGPIFRTPTSSEHSYAVDATPSGARLPHAELSRTLLHRASLPDAQLEYATPDRAELPGADLTHARFDVTTVWANLILDSNTIFADVTWDKVPLTRISCDQVRIVGDAQLARRRTDEEHRVMPSGTCLELFEAAVRANRQLAVALRDQGLNEHAGRFAYRAQMLQRKALRRQRQWDRTFGSWLLDVVAGYGYKPMHSLLTYVVVIYPFAGAYFLNAQFAARHLTWDEALVLSNSSFHGAGSSRQR
jgi:hypothetical protein